MTDRANVIELPVKPVKAAEPGGNADHAHVRARAEKTSADGLGLWLKIQSAFSGASLLDATPPALLLIWERHSTAAKPWGKVLAPLRYFWGAVHVTMIAPVCYFMVWATDSFPKLAVTTAAIVTTLLWFPHITITITI